MRVKGSRTRDQRGLTVSATDADGNVTTYTNDEAGRPTVTVAPPVYTQTNGGTPILTRPVTMTGYDTFGEDRETSDANGNVTV